METINHEYYVSLEVAKLLKEAGFDWKVNTCRYNSSPDKVSSNGTLVSNFNGYAFQHIAISTPTLDVVQRWLREVKNLILLIDITPSYYNGKPMGYKFVIHVSCGNHIYGEWKDTYEEAQEAGIKKVLELILEKGE